MAIFSKSDDGDDLTDGESPWSSRGFIASIIVVAAIAICALAWIVLGGPDDNTTGPKTGVPSETVAPTTDPTGPPATADPTPTDPTPTDPVPTATTSPRPGACGIKPGDQRITSVAPIGVAWTFEGGILVPFKSTIGPQVRDGSGIRSCYAHSPIGAVFAAMNTLAQVQDGQNAERVIRQRVVPGAGRDRALADAKAARLSPTPIVGGAAQVQFVGFKILDYAPDRALVSVAVQSGGEVDKVAGLVVSMRWSGGDWKLALRSDGSISGDPDVLGSLDGYVSFRGA
ncbi:hypothetical protein [Kribbella deserti]|uniref:DUF8175 domain-containing protein n=1 Tax=Kribbella deserti TaxID=1926257 RepID=A0ABV6QJT8_9ACTN